ncbi:MAG: hypothetical protein ACOVP1_08655 [Bacteroidia bacterium]
MKNTDHFPDLLAELIQEKSFDELNEKEKEWVIQFLEEAEYRDYHMTAQLLKIDLAEESSDEIPAIFHQTFEAKKEKKTYIIQLKAWQLAASFILISSLWIFSLKLQSSSNYYSQIKRDTIYLTQQVPGETIKIHDTVLITKTQVIVRNSLAKKDTASMQVTPPNEAIQIDQLNALRNKRKNKGIKGDTLLKNFEFVRI